METDFAKVTTDASGLAADMVRVRSERAEAEQQTDGMGSGGKMEVGCHLWQIVVVVVRISYLKCNDLGILD